MLKHLLGEAVQLETAGASGQGRIKVDPGQFEQVVMNLAINARDAMPHGGTLRLETSRVDIEGREATALQIAPGPYVRLSAVDSGTGMDDNTRARIFEPFFTTKPPGQGTGLGLSTVYGILQQSGGSIVVESVIDQGSTFKVYLPMADDQAETPPPPPRPLRRSGESQGTVFVAEDEEAVRVLIRTVLASAGFRVTRSGFGQRGCRHDSRPGCAARSARGGRGHARHGWARSGSPDAGAVSPRTDSLYHRVRDALGDSAGICQRG